MKEEPILVRCFGVTDDKLRDIGKGGVVPVPYGPPLRYEKTKTVTIFNDKIGRWQICGLVDYLEKCPVCNKHMRVQAIWGTTYLPCCSKRCYKKIAQKTKELGDLWKALGYFRKKRGEK